MTAKKKAYTRAGIDIDLSNPLKRQIQSFVKQTHPTEVLRGDPRFEKLVEESKKPLAVKQKFAASTVSRTIRQPETAATAFDFSGK
jgi:hypothetical protein